MRANGLLHSLFVLLLALTTISAAWPGHGLLGNKIDGLVRRQNDASSSAEPSSSREPSSTVRSSASATDENTSAAASETGSGDETSDVSSTATRSGADETDKPSTTGRNSTKTTAIDPRLPPGGVQMITPAAIEGQQYYKVGDFITFEWNYTSLSVTPSAVDVLASCSLNSATYTISANMSVEETGKIIWDTGESAAATNPFPVASYTLVIHDSSADVTDVPKAGYLGSYNQYVFGMYTPQPYVPLNQFRCATCSGALSSHERQALGVLGFTALVTILSFTWFANGFGAFT